MAKVIIFGTGDVARLAHFYFAHDSEHEVVAFTLDKEFLSGSEFLDKPLVDFSEVTRTYPASEYRMFIAIGYSDVNRVRSKKYAQARERGYQLVSYVSTKCSYLSETPPGDNCFILEDNTIQPFVKIGNDVTLWSGNHIGHDSVIEDHVFIASHIVVSGHCRIGDHSFLGVNATLRNGVEIAPKTIVGAGALIMKDSAEKDVFVAERTPRFKKKSDEITL